MRINGAPHGYAVDRATVRQKKTGRPVRFEMTEQTRQSIDNNLIGAERKSGDILFSGQTAGERHLLTRQYARLVSDWIAGIGLDPSLTDRTTRAFAQPEQNR